MLNGRCHYMCMCAHEYTVYWLEIPPTVVVKLLAACLSIQLSTYMCSRISRDFKYDMTRRCWQTFVELYDSKQWMWLVESMVTMDVLVYRCVSGCKRQVSEKSVEMNDTVWWLCSMSVDWVYAKSIARHCVLSVFRWVLIVSVEVVMLCSDDWQGCALIQRSHLQGRSMVEKPAQADMQRTIKCLAW